ncbi:MAG: histidine ammonia-lyase [Elusimicrobia bacterium RBG_16_66_12]|nr:MAG: histidine ammonia-lyase [Elusimicrobia bacterium RBG_16_66_12]
MPSNSFKLGSSLGLERFSQVVESGCGAVLTSAALRRVAGARRVLESAMASGKPVYGVNTGFGELASVRISRERLAQVQRNLVLSHACGVGEPLSASEARGILFLRLNELCRGRSGVRPALVRHLARMFAASIVPLIPSRGSVGASGDLAPQAHMALAVIGEGDALYRGRRMPAKKALAAAGLPPFVLSEKEGLALLNGTQAMQSVGGFALLAAERVWRAANLACATSLDALTGTPAPYDEAISRLKPHPGQITAARSLRRLLAGSEIRRSHNVAGDPRVQDSYSLRCAPQVHGAVFDRLAESRRVVETEMLSVTDNPLVAGGRLISGGNFHGQALSFAFDSAAGALAALANISERRTFQVTAGIAPRLKPFLASDPGVESGFMIAQYVAAALASENKTLAHPASADSVPTSANKEDFVSMGMWSALKFKKIVWNAAQVVAIELVSAAQAIEFHRPLKSGRRVEAGLAVLRRKVKASKGDEVLSGKLETAREMVLSGAFEEIFS